MFSNTFAGIAPASVATFVGMQLVGGAIGYVLIRGLDPNAAILAAEVSRHTQARGVAAPDSAPAGEAIR
jgi:hypothetical protein